MGTRTIVHIKDDKKTIATIYRQHDGYPTGMGDDIKKILNNGEVDLRNGFSVKDKIPKQFNGMGCLAAFLIGELKEKKIGNVYIQAPNTKDMGQDYTYTLSNTLLGNLKMKVVENYTNKTIFDGLLSHFDGEKVEGLNKEDAS
jgi:hypothetical protein